MNKYFKRILSASLIALMVFATSCGGGSKSVSVPDDYNYDDLSKYIELGNYKNVKYTDHSKDTVATETSVVNIDFEGSMNGKKFDGGTGTDYELDLGNSTFIEGFAEEIVGHKVGETFDVNVTFPKDYQEKSLAGKPAVFKTTINKIVNSEDNTKTEVFNKIVDSSKVKEYPQKELDARLEVLKKAGIKSDKSKLKSLAEKEVKKELVIYAIAEKENIKISDKEYQKQIDSALAGMNITPEQFEEQYGMTVAQYAEENNLFISFLQEKVMEVVMKTAVKE